MRLEGALTGRGNAKPAAKTHEPAGDRVVASATRQRGRLSFRRQPPAERFILDFYCAPARLAIKFDGEARNRGHRTRRDAPRDAWVVAQHMRVLRYPAPVVLANLDNVVRRITVTAIQRRSKFSPYLPLAGDGWGINGTSLLGGHRNW